MLKKGCDIPVIASIPETLPTFLAGVFFSSPFGFVEVFADEVSFFIGYPLLGEALLLTSKAVHFPNRQETPLLLHQHWGEPAVTILIVV